eukprot:CAMPEP_0178924930 /NCGR_PEP_ID=MMETSP0786-20121207/17605_1 /TAXON_ID=186022 /ORGANISM="Thalassionema frauenfeldii, Strain CCMP 1798" /LENGTH=95 /DNA_ID=CAMNT_0020599705 /DNA_START=344 /DNA_END=628 /DNA_ORIENTATION=+
MGITFWLVWEQVPYEYDPANDESRVKKSSSMQTLLWKQLPTEVFVQDLSTCSQTTLQRMVQNRGLTDSSIHKTMDPLCIHQLLRPYGQNQCSICW